MGWEQIDLNDTSLASGSPLIDPGTYTLQLIGAYDSKFRPGQTDVAFAIADEGKFRGSKVYIEIPNPDEQAWAVNLAASLIQKLGATVETGVHPKDALNEIAKNGHSRVTGDVYVETFTRKDTTTGKKNKVNTKSLRPVA